MTKTTVRGMLGAATLPLILATTTMAEGAQHCAPRDKVVERLASHYGETRQSIGLGANNAVMEVFASLETGSWTITVTMTNGLTCLVASGQAYEPLKEPLAQIDEDA